jgi:putative ABC transport system permease protein
MIAEYGWMDDPIGKRIKSFSDNNTPNSQQQEWTVIGVVKDFHYQSLYNEIEPFMIFISQQPLGRYHIKLTGVDVENTIAYIEKKVKEFGSDKEFNYEFLDQSVSSYYQSEEKLYSISLFFTWIAFLISCLGLLGLSAFVSEQKTKEIGIRKVLGASTSNIITTLSTGFLLLVLSSNLIAFPIAYYVIENKILSEFVYSVSTSYFAYILAMFIALIIATVTVTVQTYKSANNTPINSLRYE